MSVNRIYQSSPCKIPVDKYWPDWQLHPDWTPRGGATWLPERWTGRGVGPTFHSCRSTARGAPAPRTPPSLIRSDHTTLIDNTTTIGLKVGTQISQKILEVLDNRKERRSLSQDTGLPIESVTRIQTKETKIVTSKCAWLRQLMLLAHLMHTTSG